MPCDNDPHTSGQRIWAKLWDTCARHDCQYRVLTTYDGLAFGTFPDGMSLIFHPVSLYTDDFIPVTLGFSSGQVLYHTTSEAVKPTFMQSPVFHVAAAMGMWHPTLIASTLNCARPYLTGTAL